MSYPEGNSPHTGDHPKSYKPCSWNTSEVEKKLQIEQWGFNCEETTLKACSSSKLGSWSFQSPCRTLERILLDTVLLEWRCLRPKMEKKITENWLINRCCKQLVYSDLLSLWFHKISKKFTLLNIQITNLSVSLSPPFFSVFEHCWELSLTLKTMAVSYLLTPLGALMTPC